MLACAAQTKGLRRIIVILIISFAIAMLILPKLIAGLYKRGIIARDYYKRNETWVATHGGVIILLICVLSVTLYPLLFWLARWAIGAWPVLEWIEREPELLPINQHAVIVILSFGIYGLLDDYMNVGRPSKIIIPFLFTAPMY